MKNIVVYRIVNLAGLLLIGTLLQAQKPAIKLLPTAHHYMHPETMIDTSSANDSLSLILPQSQLQTDEKDSVQNEPDKKERRQIGPSFDSMFHKEEKETHKFHSVIRSRAFPMPIKYLNPVNLFIYITALK